MLKIDDIVIVKNESVYKGMQGIVMATDLEKEPGYPIAVEFHEKYNYMFGSSMGREPDYKQVLFQDSELEKNDDWSFELRCYRLFKNNFIRTATIESIFNSDQICCIKECSQVNAQRVLVNIWGSVYEFDMCPQHADQFHGKCVDDVPCKE